MDIQQVVGSSYVAQAVSDIQPVTRSQVAEVQPVKADVAKSSPTTEQVQQAVAKINNVVQAINSGVEFKVEDNARTVIVTVVDKSNDEVIRQIPTEEAIKISFALEALQGLIIKQRV